VTELFVFILPLAAARATHSRDSALRQSSGESGRIRVLIDPSTIPQPLGSHFGIG